MIDFRDSVHSVFIDEPDMPKAPIWMRFVLFGLLVASMFVPLFGPLVTAYFVNQTAMARLRYGSKLVAIIMFIVLIAVIGVGIFDTLNFELKNNASVIVHVGYSVFCLIALWLSINLLPRRKRQVGSEH